jgi:peptide deformylase
VNAQAILVDGDPRLRTPSSPVVRIDCDEIARLVGALADARRRLGFGRAIAAPQIGVMKRMIAIDLGAGPFVVVNPEIVWRSDETREVWDDCFSVPDRLARVRRHVSISLRFQDGEMRARSWERLRPDDAELLQHEIDHLDGVLMLDRAEEVVPATPRGRREEPRLSLARIREASEHVDPVFLRTPQFVCEPLADALGCRLVLKVETANPIRCFKGRGAEYFVGKRGAEAPFVCASAGNF